MRTSLQLNAALLPLGIRVDHAPQSRVLSNACVHDGGASGAPVAVEAGGGGRVETRRSLRCPFRAQPECTGEIRSIRRLSCQKMRCSRRNDINSMRYGSRVRRLYLAFIRRSQWNAECGTSDPPKGQESWRPTCLSRASGRFSPSPGRRIRRFLARRGFCKHRPDAWRELSSLGKACSGRYSRVRTARPTAGTLRQRWGVPKCRFR